MPVPKLKNLTILVLLLANLCLALVVFPSRAGIRREEDALRQSLSDLYARQEISLSPQIIPDTASLYVLELTESSESDLQAALILLGEQLLVQDDSTRYLSAFRSSLGQCSISRSGEFSAQLNQSKAVRDPQRACEKLLKDMGFSHLPLQEPQQHSNGSYTITATQTILDIPIFSRGLTFTWENGCLTTLDGVFFTNTDTLKRVSDKACLSAADALVHFLDAAYDLGWVGSELLSIRQGYIRSETATATAVRLTPVWQLETDTGSFQIHGMTGDVMPIT